jgi:TolB-like protein
MTGAIGREIVKRELANALRSATFARARRARELLGYLIANSITDEPRRLKEAIIALEVFSRDAAIFDGDRDGIVRVAVNRLRELLDRYYASEGVDASIRFEIPRGSYTPILRRRTPGGLPETPRVVVLPLLNLTGDAGEDALCDGLTEDVIDALAQMKALRVVARTSSFVYKNRALDVRRIARELSVDAVLEGSVQRVGEAIRVTAQLILASDGTHLWSRALEVDFDDRDDLRDALVDTMQRSLSSSATPASPPAGGALPEAAKKAYYRGLYAYRKDSNDGFLQAEAALNEAIGLAPTFARALAALAKVHWALGNAGIRSLREASVVALACAERAHALDSEDAVVLATRGSFQFFVEYQPLLAYESAKRAIAHGVHSLDAHLFHAKVCTYLERFDEAAQSLALAREIDPLSTDPLHGMIARAIVMHDYPLALAQCDELLAIEPNSSVASWNRGHVLRKLGRYDECDANFAQSVARWPTSARYTTLIAALTRASTGELDAARALRTQALTEIPWHEDPMTYATIDALLGDEPAVLDAWEHSIAARDPYVYLSYYHEEFDPYRRHPRFIAAVRALNLPTSHVAAANE